MMNEELLHDQPQRQHQQQRAPEPRRYTAHPWAQTFGKPGERVIRAGNGWSVRAIHFPNGPAVVAAQGPLADDCQTEYARLVRLGFSPQQATALIVMKLYQYAEGDCAERERQRRRLAYARYLVESGRLSDGTPRFSCRLLKISTDS